MDVGSRVKELRAQAGLSGNQLAKNAGIAQTSVSAIELGKVAPTTEMLGRICGALGITLAEFFEDDVESIPVDIKRLLNAARLMTRAERSLLTEFLTSILSSDRKNIPVGKMQESSENLSNSVIPTVEQVAAHFEGEYGIYDEELASHILDKIKLALGEYDVLHDGAKKRATRAKGKSDKRG